jgi:hypothetical protein
MWKDCQFLLYVIIFGFARCQLAGWMKNMNSGTLLSKDLSRMFDRLVPEPEVLETSVNV